MKKLIIFLMFAFSTISHAKEKSMASPNYMVLRKQDIVLIDPPLASPRKDFDDNLGYLEIRILKNSFIYEAPNCRSNIIVRMGLVARIEKNREELMERRWQLVQDLHAVVEGKKESVIIPLNSAPYIKLNSSGERILEYCNAYMPKKFWNYLPNQVEAIESEKPVEQQNAPLEFENK